MERDPMFTYLEFLEFSSAAEFKKFRNMPVITREEVEGVDMDELCERFRQEQLAPKRRPT